MEIDSKRLARYRQKTRRILSALEELFSRPSRPRGLVLRGIYYNIITAIESAMDIAAMLVRDLRDVPVGDTENVGVLTQHGMLTQDLAQRLLRCIALRNVLIHRYNGIDEQRVMESISEVDGILREYVEVVEGLVGGP